MFCILAMTMVHLICIMFAHGLPDCTCVPGTCGFFILPMVGHCDGSHDLTLCLFIFLLTEQMYPTPLSTGVTVLPGCSNCRQLTVMQ